MKKSSSRPLGSRLGSFVVLAIAFTSLHNPMNAASFTTQVFATGGAVNSTAPDSVTFGGGSVWIEYGNGASSTDYTGTSTIVQYSTSGAVQSTYRIAGSVDGLKYNPNTGMVWALQNQDAISQLMIINPATKMTTSYTYGPSYKNPTTSGFDDVAFQGNNVYLSATNPASGTDSIIYKLNNPSPTSPIALTPILSQGTLLATDADSLKANPNGGLVLTGASDGALTFVSNPGQPNQTATSLQLLTSPGTKATSLDDSVMPTATSGIFYVADTGANTVFAIAATGLTSNSLFADAGKSFNSVDPATGLLTPIFTGTSPHGAVFVATPEPASVALSFAGLLLGGFAVARKRVKA